ncbi:uncharacterized protein EI97DRAFT_433106, partial [Westerdykella ornata]
HAITLPPRHDPQYPPLIKCLQESHSGYPNDGSTPTSQEMRKCVEKIKSNQHDAVVARDDEELIWEPEEGDNVQTRDIIDTVQVLGKSLFLDKKATLCSDGLNDEFMWAEDMREKVQPACDRMKGIIEELHLREDAGVGTVIDKLTKGHDKQGHQLKDNRKLTATYLISLYKPAGIAMNEIKALSSGIYDLCNDGLHRLLSKGDGCTADLTYYRPSKAKHYTDTGAVSGVIRIFWGSENEPVADLSVSYTNED